MGQQEDWRFLDGQEVLRKARAEIGREAGRESGRKRKARPWWEHARDLAKAICAKEPRPSDGAIASEIENRWKLDNVKCPGHRTLEAYVSELTRSGTLPQRTGSLRK